MTKTQCDNCRELGEAPPPPGWIIIAVEQPPSEDDGPFGHGAEMTGTFCGWACVAQYATVKALIPAEDPQGGAS